MKVRYTVKEYSEKIQVDLSTIYRQIKSGKIQSELVDGVLHVVCDEENGVKIEAADANVIANDANSNQNLIAQMQSEIEFLHKELSKATETIAQMQQDAESAKERSDTIVLQLTQQLSEQTKLLEDMRQKEEKKGGFFKRLLGRKER